MCPSRRDLHEERGNQWRDTLWPDELEACLAQRAGDGRTPAGGAVGGGARRLCLPLGSSRAAECPGVDRIVASFTGPL